MRKANVKVLCIPGVGHENANIVVVMLSKCSHMFTVMPSAFTLALGFIEAP